MNNIIIDKSNLSYDIWFLFNIIIILIIIIALTYIPYLIYKNNILLKEINKKLENNENNRYYES